MEASHFHRATIIAVAFLLTVSISQAKAHRTTPATGAPATRATTKLINKLCMMSEGEDREFCFKVLDNPEAKAAGEDFKALIPIILKLAAADAKATFEEIKVLLKTQNLSYCLETFDLAAHLFSTLPASVQAGETDWYSANYDIATESDKAQECNDSIEGINVPRVLAGTKCLTRWAVIASRITDWENITSADHDQ